LFNALDEPDQTEVPDAGEVVQSIRNDEASAVVLNLNLDVAGLYPELHDDLTRLGMPQRVAHRFLHDLEDSNGQRLRQIRRPIVNVQDDARQGVTTLALQPSYESAQSGRQAELKQPGRTQLTDDAAQLSDHS